MEDGFFNVPLQEVKKDLRRGIADCSSRGLLHSTKWLAEMNHGLADVNINSKDSNNALDYKALTGVAPEEYDNYFLAKSYFDVREYERSAYFIRDAVSPVPRFLYLYATYMALEKRKLDSATDHSNLNDSGHIKEMAELLGTLRLEESRGKLDGYGLYLYGVVLKALDLEKPAEKILMKSIKAAPLLWSSYLELSTLIRDKDKLQSINLGGHWMKNFFVAHTYVELYLNDEALKAYEDLQGAGFRDCVYVTSQMAIAYHNRRNVEKAIEIFKGLQEADPYRLDNMDTYSNLLFVKELRTEMAHLAHKVVAINKYRPETCCVVGNYYSIRCDHQMAIMNFQRALKLNPKYLAAWTLMGHEFMELKNTNAAIQSYRKAVEVNKRDYRAWYGLGQAYEILKMHYYSLYYFKIAYHLRPHDSRMLVALGESFEKLEKYANAIKCYSKACEVGDIEGIARYKMANLHEKLGSDDLAAQCYEVYCNEENSSTDTQSLYHGYITLANYYERKGDYDRASHYAYKLLESDDVARKSEAKALLKTIVNKRNGKASTNSLGVAPIQDNSSSSDDEMDLESNDYNLIVHEYLENIPTMDELAQHIATSTTPRVIASPNVSELPGASNRNYLGSLATVTTRRRSPLTEETSMSESDMTGNTSEQTTNTNSRRTLLTVTNPSTNQPYDEDEETPSMEVSSISID